jgi:phospholipid/cholesterol/gamma-HCH transport system permease protein
VPALVARLNAAALNTLQGVQNYVQVAWKALRFVFARPFYAGDLVQQMDAIGVQSLGIVLLTGFFTGMVLALQSSVQLRTFGATQYIGSLVSASMIRELGPVLAGLMVAGRVGSGVAAQIGSMRVTEQIDALNTLGTDPIKKLVTPRARRADHAAGAHRHQRPRRHPRRQPDRQAVRGAARRRSTGGPCGSRSPAAGFSFGFIPNDFIQGLVKPFVFGGIITTTACYYGLATTGGTEGVGVATTRTGGLGEHRDPHRRLLPHPDPPRGARRMRPTDEDVRDDRRQAEVERRDDGRAADAGQGRRVRAALRDALDDPMHDGDERPRAEDPGPAPGAVIELEKVHLGFDERVILEDVSFLARKGETIAVVGESGTGKSTTLKLILRHLIADKGRVYVQGTDICRLSFDEALKVRERMGMVFQGRRSSTR